MSTPTPETTPTIARTEKTTRTSPTTTATKAETVNPPPTMTSTTTTTTTSTTTTTTPTPIISMSDETNPTTFTMTDPAVFVEWHVPGGINTNDENDPNGRFVVGRVISYCPKSQTYQVQAISSESEDDANEDFGHGLDSNGQIETWTQNQVDYGIQVYNALHKTLHDGTNNGHKIQPIRAAKLFEKKVYLGTVTSVKLPLPDDTEDDEGDDDEYGILFHICYDDGDEEDMDLQELADARNLFQKETTVTKNKAPRKRRAPTTVPTSMVSMDSSKKVKTTTVLMGNKEETADASTTGRLRRRKPVIYTESNDADDDDDDVDMITDKDDQEADVELNNEDTDDDLEADSIHADDDDVYDMDTKPSTASKGRSRKTKTLVSSTNTKSSDKTHRNQSHKKLPNDELQEEFNKRLASQIKATAPKNNPQKMPDVPYVDPVGVDPTNGIVEGIVGAQVRKIGGLLLAAVKTRDENRISGELTFPIKLQTACSGTDAPSIGLGLIKESLDRVVKDKISGPHGFEYEHVMSCEIEPFKQAYIGRNFPGVPLFPDITKLTASDQVLDVYGRPQTIPDGNLFVAGTSCKDFSMLKSTDRLDIEDKGTSGETFLSAVEFLDQKQPPTAIFENVDGAPWAKMQEYITGRVQLSQRNDTKAIKDSNKKGDADNKLLFSVDSSNGRYVAEEIPRQVGIRAGSVVQGFVRSGHDSNDVETLVADRNQKGLVTLKEMAKKHGIDLDADTLVMEKRIRYCTHLCKVDTKDYGLPQTRNRKYLYIWKSDDPDDDLGEYFQEILDKLKTPLLHSMEAFLLPESHDRIRCFREALRSGPGLLVKRERAKQLNFWDYSEARAKDVIQHYAFRQVNGIDEKSRYLTGWDTRGRKLLAPGLWPELVDCWDMRRLDMIDCFGAAAIRDSIPRDPLHHSFTWDLSQNVTRAPFRMATVGVCGCVTPGGELLLPHKGRTVMGYEKLLLQGIPFSRLLLGPESEVQISDLAGNAMSVPVICATMISALCAPELRRQRMKDRKILLANFELSQKHDLADGEVVALRGDLFHTEYERECKSFVQVFGEVSKKLALDAHRSSVLCTCESSGTTSKDSCILECVGCGFGVCHDCSGRYRMFSHELKDIDVHGTDGRPDPHAFERTLRCAVPSSLRLGKGWESILDNGKGLESYSFQLQQIDRQQGRWVLFYGAWEDYGSGRQVAEIRVVLGKIGRLDSEVGIAGYIRCFAPAIRHTKPHRGKLRDSARLLMQVSEIAQAKWEVPIAAKKFKLLIAGSDPTYSQRLQAGLNDDAYKSLKSHSTMKSFIPSFQATSRNNHLAYHPLWKTYPGTIEISGDPTGQVNGTYRRLKCEQTIVLSALWRREGSKPMYIFIRPDVIRAELDVAVISPSPSYKDGLEICELEDWIPENALVEDTHTTTATFLMWKSAPENLTIDIPRQVLSMDVQTRSFHDRVCNGNETDTSKIVLCEMSGLSKDVASVLLEFNEENNHDIDLFGRSGTRNAKRLSIIAAPSLIKSAAEGKLPLSLSEWYRLPLSSEYGHCEVHVPPRPLEMWRVVKAGKKMNVERFYDGEQSNEYYQKLFNRPAAFGISIKKDEGKLIVYMNPHVAAHRAAALLGGEKDGFPTIDYRLSELTSMGEPDTKVFHVPNSDAYEETTVDGMTLPLYKRQAKALTRMLAIESGDVMFSEEERSEHVLSGIGWCMIARAAKKTPLRGGVLGDAIGSGKTVVTIALILAGVSKARANRNATMGRSGATLVVVPPGLVSQWDEERRKFTGSKLKCILIDSTATLRCHSVEEICSADVVIVPAGILEEGKSGTSRPYTEHLSKMAGSGPIPPAPAAYSQREAPTIEGTWVRNMAPGPSVYVGNKGNQRTRDAQAYYSHCYSEAIIKLRQKTFGIKEKGVPLEYFTWERIVIDECHETLVTGKKHESTSEDFKEKARRGAREFLGVSQTDIRKRPLVAALSVWGLTGTPLLETEARVTELASLMGGTYLTGAAHHWRKEERESGRDLFLNQQEATRSREYRCAVQDACHSYVAEACQRNRGEKLNVSLIREQVCVNMTTDDGDAFCKITRDVQGGFSVAPDQLGEKSGDVLAITASSKARHHALLEKIGDIERAESGTKIIVFSNRTYGGYESASLALRSSGTPFCEITDKHSVQEQNEIISWFRHVDATDEDRSRPRILLLSFEQAAGHNLQEACHNVILYDPMYSGSDAVADASVEEQAVGRVMRQGQTLDVTVTRIVVKGPNGERCLDDWIVDRNLDNDVLAAATSNFD